MIDLSRSDQHSHIAKWHPPSIGTLKVNVYITILFGANYCYMTIVSRNYKGFIVFLYAAKVDISILDIVETRVILQAMEVLLS